MSRSAVTKQQHLPSHSWHPHPSIHVCVQSRSEGAAKTTNSCA